MNHRKMLGIDLGGSGFRIGIFDCETGSLLEDFIQVDHDESHHPDVVLPKICSVLEALRWNGPIGLGFPGAVGERTLMTAPNIGKEWLDATVIETLEECCGGPVALINDADAVAVAEVKFGSGRGEQGRLLTLTIGTGLGTTIHEKGVLLPNLEYGLAPHPTRKGTLEEHISGRARTVFDLTLIQWSQRFQEGLDHLYEEFNPDRIVLYGGIMEHWDELRHLLHAPCRLLPATHAHTAGALGAAFCSTLSSKP